MAVKAMDLFEAYKQDKLPRDQGYIVSSFFNDTSAYSIYEVVSYSGVKEIHPTETGLVFQTSGKKLHLLVEPASYPNKAMEPVNRTEAEKIPLRFSELDMLISKNESRLYIAKKPVECYSSFTILKPTGVNFALVFYNLPDIYDSLGSFFEKTLNKEAQIPLADAKKAAKKAVETVSKAMNFKGEYSGE